MAISSTESMPRTRLSIGTRLPDVIGSLKRPFSWIRSEYRTRRNIDALLELDDRALADIGLGRSDILYVARYGRPPRRRYD